MTSEALDGQLQSCYAARARPKCLTEDKCFRLRLNRATELQHKVSMFRECQTAGAEHLQARSAKRVLVVGLCSRGVDEKRSCVDSRGLMWWLRYAGVDVCRILYRVLTSMENLDNLEISGNFVTLENSGKTQGI